jgi:hypothetical protein
MDRILMHGLFHMMDGLESQRCVVKKWDEELTVTYGNIGSSHQKLQCQSLSQLAGPVLGYANDPI